MSALSEVLTREPWMDRAACIGHDPTMWDEDMVRPDARVREAIRICRACPVAAQCLRSAERTERGSDSRLRQGVYGGLTHLQRWAAAALRRGECVPCVSCNRLMRPGSTHLDQHPDTIRHHADGLCATCARVWPIVMVLRECEDCGRVIRPRGVTARELPGSVAHGGGAKCVTCYQRAHRVRRRIPSECVSCGRAMRPRRTTLSDHPGTVPYSAKGLCNPCYLRALKEKTS
jgi:hypothetical protein